MCNVMGAHNRTMRLVCRIDFARAASRDSRSWRWLIGLVTCVLCVYCIHIDSKLGDAVVVKGLSRRRLV